MLDGKAYWERAGELGYENFEFRSPEVATHILSRIDSWVVELAETLQIPHRATVIDLGCGDGRISKTLLSRRYTSVTAYDLSESSIRRAAADAPPNVRFLHADVTTMYFEPCDAAFLLGILHHVKGHARTLVERLSTAAPKVVVLEPNGDQILRKLVECTPRYRAAGEQSFTRREVRSMFEDAGYRLVAHRRVNLFPNFTPQWIYRMLRRLEPRVEQSPFLSKVCTENIFAFKKFGAVN